MYVDGKASAINPVIKCRLCHAGWEGKFTPEMSNVVTCRRHVDTFSENIIAKRISTYIHTDSYVQGRYGKVMLCRCDSLMSAKSSDSLACPRHVQLRT